MDSFSLYGWPSKDNILIKVQTKKLPQIFNTLSFQKETFSNCEGKHGEELQPSALPGFTKPWLFTLKTCAAAALCFGEAKIFLVATCRPQASHSYSWGLLGSASGTAKISELRKSQTFLTPPGSPSLDQPSGKLLSFLTAKEQKKDRYSLEKQEAKL